MNIATRFEISVNAASLSGGGSIVPKERKHPEVNDIELGIHLSEYGFFSAGRKKCKKGEKKHSFSTKSDKK